MSYESALLVAFTSGLIVGVILAGATMGAAYLGLITRSWISKRRGEW